MSGLEQAFYIVGIIYMGISLLLIIALAVAVGVIRSKIISLETVVREKIDFVTSIPGKVEGIIDGIRSLKSSGHK